MSVPSLEIPAKMALLVVIGVWLAYCGYLIYHGYKQRKERSS